VSPPWTQTISVAWRPELSFYEKRIAILRVLEDRGDLTAFRVRDDTVEARLFGGAGFMSVRQGGLRLQLRGPDTDVEKAWAAATSAVSDLDPALPRSVSVSFQHVLELSMAFDDAVDRGYARLFAGLPHQEVRFADWALLSDLEFQEPAAVGLIEFGIVRDHEIEQRLARQVGRAGAEDPTQGFTWDKAGFPKVALFADTTLRGALAPGALGHVALLDATRVFWEGCRARVGTLVDGLYERLSDDEGAMTG
jgi:hypothetical protein